MCIYNNNRKLYENDISQTYLLWILIGEEGCYHPYGVNSMIFGPIAINEGRGQRTWRHELFDFLN